MPLYDCMLLLKPNIAKEVGMDLVSRVGKHIYRRNGVITDMKSFGEVQLGYGIKKLDGRYYKGTLMQMTMMTPPSFNSELHYLNKEDRLLRWLLVKHRDVKFGVNVLGEDDVINERGFRSKLLYDDDNIEDDEGGDDDDDEFEEDEQSETKEG
ncbi:37S ribosomal protein mrp17 mitochondrial [Phtheirospermum japonicum]|uniref:37S ribosomal protein mrp17 mitochondrial n=1 Tax=Phtheirospermum japonicum TaxID=374723 RepID=A0A830C4M5_9LAMI|nr:37S ribosomal protein mrp17 mitochondrial [Phtheirospermum japonicum]